MIKVVVKEREFNGRTIWWHRKIRGTAKVETLRKNLPCPRIRYQHLWFKEIRLCNLKTLTDYGIKDGSTLLMNNTMARRNIHLHVVIKDHKEKEFWETFLNTDVTVNIITKIKIHYKFAQNPDAYVVTYKGYNISRHSKTLWDLNMFTGDTIVVQLKSGCVPIRHPAPTNDEKIKAQIHHYQKTLTATEMLLKTKMKEMDELAKLKVHAIEICQKILKATTKEGLQLGISELQRMGQSPEQEEQQLSRAPSQNSLTSMRALRSEYGDAAIGPDSDGAVGAEQPASRNSSSTKLQPREKDKQPQIARRPSLESIQTEMGDFLPRPVTSMSCASEILEEIDRPYSALSTSTIRTELSVDRPDSPGAASSVYTIYSDDSYSDTSSTDESDSSIKTEDGQDSKSKPLDNKERAELKRLKTDAVEKQKRIEELEAELYELLPGRQVANQQEMVAQLPAKKWIQANFDELVQSIAIDETLDIMVSKDVITFEYYEICKSKPTDIEKARTLLPKISIGPEYGAQRLKSAAAKFSSTRHLCTQVSN